MNSAGRRSMIRVGMLGGVLWYLLACQGNTCTCIRQVSAPMEEKYKVYDAIQTRITPSAFTFIQSHLKDIISILLKDGLSYVVPHVQLFNVCVPVIGWPCANEDICVSPCTLTAEIMDAAVDRVYPDVLTIGIHLNIDGLLPFVGTCNCNVPLAIRYKPARADVRFVVDSDRLLTFTIENVSFPYNGDLYYPHPLNVDDWTYECPWPCDWIVGAAKGALTDYVNTNILEPQITKAISDVITQATCLPCNYYSGGCPGWSNCDSATNTCKRYFGGCIHRPFGADGSVDVGALVAASLPGIKSNLGVFVAAGQYNSASYDPLIRSDGVEVRIVGGIAPLTKGECNGVPNPSDIPPNYAPSRLNTTDYVPGTSTRYMAAIGLSDVFLDWALYQISQSGLLCISIASSQIQNLLSSDTLSLLFGSLNDLTGDVNSPLMIKLVPTHPPYVEVGAGTFTSDGKIDKPLLYVFWPGVSLDFYVHSAERWVRFVSLAVDLKLELSIEFTPDNYAMAVIGEPGLTVDNYQASNFELLAESFDQSTLDSIKGLVDTMLKDKLSQLTAQAFQLVQIPKVEGFSLDVKAIKGVQPRYGTNYFEFAGIYADLTFSSPKSPPRKTYATLASVRWLKVPVPPDSKARPLNVPEVMVEVGADPGPEAEFSYRVDNGLWHAFSRERQLLVRDASLRLVGQHLIEVQARTVGDYRSLDPNPAQIPVEIPALNEDSLPEEPR